MAREEEMGASMGALSSVMDIGHAAGPLVTGVIITTSGFVQGFFASFLIAAVVCVVFAISVRDQKT
jgi:predicted MFS family arabinose efflux permease